MSQRTSTDRAVERSRRGARALATCALATVALVAAGLTAPSAGAAVGAVTYIDTGASWRYLDTGKLQSGWERASFNDTTWKLGPAQLGAGDGDESTRINRLSPGHTQDFFRGRFQVADRTKVASVALSLMADDGAVVYLNGARVVVDNMNSTGTAAAKARTGVDESTLRSFALPVANLVNGTNVLAVVVYQVSTTDADSSFAARVVAQADLGTTTTTARPVTTTTSTTSTSTTTTAPPTTTTTTAPPTTVPATSFQPDVVRASIGGCQLYPKDHFLNATGVDRLPTAAQSSTWTSFLGGSATPLKAGFGSLVWDGSRAGMPMNVVDSRTIGRQQVLLDYSYTDQSYTGGYPVPGAPVVEGDPTPQWDKHVIMVDKADCTSYELIQYDSLWRALFGSVKALAGAKVPLGSTTAGFTTNAAQTPMVGQNVLVSEVNAGVVPHAIGFCTTEIAPGHTWPARHSDGKSVNASALPMGAWLRLKASKATSGFTGQALPIVEAMKRHGIILTDTCGLRFGLFGENSTAWNDAQLAQLGQLTAADFEVVDPSTMKVSDSSWAIR